MEKLIFIGVSPRLKSRLEALGKARGMEVISQSMFEIHERDANPSIIVAELELEGVIEEISGWKKQWPDCLIVGSIRFPVQEQWHAAIAAGCDFVSNWGALPARLKQKIDARQEGETLAPQTQRLKVILNERAGNGLVGRLPDAPDGPIVIFRVDEKLCAFRDVCPHAGFSLADGKLEGSVVTCPEHGSQFDVCTGDRLRGPSDYPIRVYPIVQKGEELFVEI